MMEIRWVACALVYPGAASADASWKLNTQQLWDLCRCKCVLMDVFLISGGPLSVFSAVGHFSMLNSLDPVHVLLSSRRLTFPFQTATPSEQQVQGQGHGQVRDQYLCPHHLSHKGWITLRTLSCLLVSSAPRAATPEHEHQHNLGFGRGCVGDYCWWRISRAGSTLQTGRQGGDEP